MFVSIECVFLMQRELGWSIENEYMKLTTLLELITCTWVM